ncbi:MAG: ATP synthase F1 subunit delta [Deltaproteobacteria bacterium]|nr:ATP synthase F1 subunit delta [Deltaproteobacteria bacterium]
MAQDKVSQRYAKAIFDYLKDEAKARTLISELKEFAFILEGHKELTFVLTSHVYSEAERNLIVEDLVSRAKLSVEAKKVLLVLCVAKRLDHVASIAERLQLIVLESANVVSLNVETATNLEANEKKKIEEKFRTILGKKVEARYKVDPTLIGGIKATVGGRTYDGSLMGWLHSFEENLISG